MPSITKALGEATASSGGYLVPDEFSNRLLALIQQKTIVMDDLDVRQMISDVQYIPKVTSGTTAYWVLETGTINESTPAYGQITLTAKKIASLVQASSEILEDNNVDLANHLVDQMATDLAISIDAAVLTGSCNTASNSGAVSPFYGLYHTASITNGVDATGATGRTGIWGTGSSTASGGVTGANIALNGIAQAVTEILLDKHEQPDVSYWNPRTIGSLIKLTDSTTRPVFNMETFGSPLLAEGVIGRIYGTSVKQSAQVPINLIYGTTTVLSGCSDALVGKSKMFGILGQRRGFIWKTDYVIATDIYQWQTTARMAFAVKYPDAYCLIRGILN
ncbi:MAG TPA: phage major capsid protein [Candidatus Glassbacteria bacterium]|nr:phage major capsid protein [Candidatus Glassbacteria bacterium]